MSTVVKIDSRICVKRSENGFNIDRQDISVHDTMEVLTRLAMYMRCGDFGAVGTWNQVIDSFEVSPDEPIDNPKVCIAFDYETHKIQGAVIGMNTWDACVLLEHANTYLSLLQMGLLTE
jgi:hypothetical protein